MPRAPKHPYEEWHSGELSSESTDEARRRAKRVHDEEVAVRAKFLLDNDPEVTTMREARQKAREQIEEIAQVQKGLLDPTSGELTKKGREVFEEKRKESGPKATSPGPGKGPSRSRRATTGTVRSKTARAVIQPFGSAASAGWTFFLGSLSLVLLYVGLRSSGTVGDLISGVASGFRRVQDPWSPLIPTKRESAPPPPTVRIARAGRGPRIHRTRQTARR